MEKSYILSGSTVEVSKSYRSSSISIAFLRTSGTLAKKIIEINTKAPKQLTRLLSIFHRLFPLKQQMLLKAKNKQRHK